jgi:hypothetical protein
VVLLMKGSRVEVRQGRKGGELAMQEQGKGQELEQEQWQGQEQWPQLVLPLFLAHRFSTNHWVIISYRCKRVGPP